MPNKCDTLQEFLDKNKVPENNIIKQLMEEVEEDKEDIIVQIEEKPVAQDFTESGLSLRIVNMVFVNLLH